MGLTGRLRRLEGEVEEEGENREEEERGEEEKEHEEEKEGEQKVKIEERHGEKRGVEEKVHHHIERKQKEENKGRIKVEMRGEGRKGLGEEWGKVEEVHHDRKSLKMSGEVVKKEKDDAKRRRSFRLDYITDMIGGSVRSGSSLSP